MPTLAINRDRLFNSVAQGIRLKTTSRGLIVTKQNRVVKWISRYHNYGLTYLCYAKISNRWELVACLVDHANVGLLIYFSSTEPSYRCSNYWRVRHLLSDSLDDYVPENRHTYNGIIQMPVVISGRSTPIEVIP